MNDEILVEFDPGASDAEAIQAIILDEGYESERLERPSLLQPDSEEPSLERVVRFENEPEFYREAMNRAQREGLPVLLDFWATWCAPCVRFKEETLSDAGVAQALDGFIVVEIDTDEFPSLADTYGISTVPDIFLIDAEGVVVERLREFEPPEQFLQRVRRLTSAMEGSTRKD
ncbi:MAG: thioredoxin [Planctomycetota bacterium]|nr:MAG: thioredoxin [Planctomycetota bacterium]